LILEKFLRVPDDVPDVVLGVMVQNAYRWLIVVVGTDSNDRRMTWIV